jgi:hypothetical protein
MTAVEWLQNEMAIKVLRSGRLSKSVLDLFEQALELEKQQIIAAVEWNYKSNMGEVYYNAVYKNETK